MSDLLPERADIRQLRTQAKELLRSLASNEPAALELARRFDPSLNPSHAKLWDAQRLTARRYGFSSWPKLVEEVEIPVLRERFKAAIRSGEFETLERLLNDKPALRKELNEPLFDFGSTPFIQAAHNKNAKRILPLLVRHGADPNVRSNWWAGGFSALDGADLETVDLLVSLGAEFDVWSASAHGRLEILERLLDEDPSRVNAPGGDGERPLHFAGTPVVAELLIKRGADLELRDVDHESTAIQYQVNRPDIIRILLAHGAKPDIFTAAVLDDVSVLGQILEQDPNAATARVGAEPFVTCNSNGQHIYSYRLGANKTPEQVAAERGSRRVLAKLMQLGTANPARRLIAAAWEEDAGEVAAILEKHPFLGSDLSSAEAVAVTTAAQEGRTETVRLLLEAGFDPLTPGTDSGTALHVACWFGHAATVKLLVNLVPLDLGDAHHGSPPLGWALHGAQFCRNPKGDYPAVVESLVVAGADVNAPANSSGDSMLKQAGDREDVKAVLRRHGVR